MGLSPDLTAKSYFGTDSALLESWGRLPYKQQYGHYNVACLECVVRGPSWVGFKPLISGHPGHKLDKGSGTLQALSRANDSLD